MRSLWQKPTVVLWLLPHSCPSAWPSWWQKYWGSNCGSCYLRSARSVIAVGEGPCCCLLMDYSQAWDTIYFKYSHFHSTIQVSPSAPIKCVEISSHETCKENFQQSRCHNLRSVPFQIGRRHPSPGFYRNEYTAFTLCGNNILYIQQFLFIRWHLKVHADKWLLSHPLLRGSIWQNTGHILIC